MNIVINIFSKDNNIYDIEFVGKGIKEISNNTLFIVDISQTAGFEDISINYIKAEIMSNSIF